MPVALSADDYIELLPAQWRKVNAYGMKIARRTYDSEELNPLRLQPSGIREHGDRWEIRHDPYDISKVHVRGPDGWITVFCTWTGHRSRSASSPGTTPAAASAARRPRSRSPTPPRRFCAARTPDPGSRRNPR